MRKYLIAALFAGMLAVPNLAHAICTTALITTSSTQLAAANFGGQGAGRGPLLQFVGGTSCPAYCDMDVTAAPTAGQGYLIPNGAITLIPATQHSNRTFPEVPSGAIWCIVPSNQGCSSQNVSVCSY